MDTPDRKAILVELLAAFDRGEEPDQDRILATHRGEEDTVRALVQAARSLAAPGPVPELAAGDTLGDFELVSKVAQGGMGTVYVARQRSLGGRRVALKVARSSDQRPSQRERTRREAILLAPLHHPHLSEVYGFGEERGLLFIAMQLVEGRDLRELAPQLRGSFGPDSVRRIVTWGAQVAEGLAALHAHGLIHRDVKPANIVIGGESVPGDLPAGAAVLVDFGLVREVRGSGATTTANLATPSYAAPEQLLGLEVGPAADTFALGVTLHDLLSEQDRGESAHAAAGLDPLDATRPGLDRDLVALVAKTTDPDPRWRYQDGAALHADLAAWLAGEAVSARHPPAFERAQRWIGTHPQKLLRTFAIGLGIVLLASGLVAVGRYSGAAERARTSLERGELIAFQDAVREIPGLLRGPFLTGPGVARAASEIEAEPERGGLAAVVERMRAEDATGALFAAATSLEQSGYGANATLRHFVENTLDGKDTEGRMTPLARRALGLIARLFYESPVVDAESLASTGPVREALRALWGQGTLRHHERLLVLTSLAGCGAGSDASWILAWGMADREDPEDVRMSLQAVERILRRAHRCGGIEGLDVGALERSVLPLLRDVYGGGAGPTAPGHYGYDLSSPQGVGTAARGLATALCYARREAGGESELLELVPESWRELDAEAADLVVPLGYAPLGEWLWDLDERKMQRFNCHEVGWICATQARPELTARCRLRYVREGERDPDRGGWAACFDAGFERGAGRMRGVFDAALPDADTLLTVRDAPDPMRPIDLVSTPAWDEVRDALAAWDFTSQPPRLTGIARGANARYFSFARDESDAPYLRFGRFGKSEVELVLDVTEQVLALHTLELVHLAAARPYYPYGGEAYIDVELDDKPIERLLVLGAQPHAGRVELNADLLSPGRHVLRIRSHPDTTTTYRLEQVALRVSR